MRRWKRWEVSEVGMWESSEMARWEGSDADVMWKLHDYVTLIWSKK